MPRYIYKAKRSPTEIIEGKIEAENQHQAAVKLSERGLFTINIEEETSAYIKRSRNPFFFLAHIPLRDLSNFTRQLSNLLDSGLTMLNGLGVLIDQTDNLRLRQVIESVRGDVKDGATFSAALAKHPKVFSVLYVNMVASGELSGTLEGVLRRLSEFLEKDEDMLSKIRASLAYPMLMAFVGSVTIFVLLSFVAPRLTAIFSDLGQALPLPTQILITISSFFSKFWFFILALIAAAAILFGRWAHTKAGKTTLDKLKLKLPFIGQFVKKAEISRFGRTLGTLVANGVPIIQAMNVATNTIDNDIIKEELDKARKDVVEGASISRSIKKTGHFPSMMVNMIAVGEESGSLESALFKVADAYDTEIDRTIKTITSLLEPVLILFMGIIVGFIVIAMLLPIFQLNMMVR